MAVTIVTSLGKVAPDWVPFLEIPRWLKERFGVEISADWMHDLFSMVRRNNRIMHYRVGGLSSDPANFNHARINRVLSGLMISKYHSGQIMVGSWDDADFDPLTFTVAGHVLKGGTLSRHPIEVCWVDAELWVAQRIAAQRRAQAAAVKGTADRPVPRNRGGAPTQHDWDTFWIAVALYASANDLFKEDRRAVRKYMEDWTSRHMDDPAPSPQTIRSKLQRLFEAVDSAKGRA